MVFAIASGARPEQGLYTAIIGGGLVSIFGGSRLQIAGPTGAFVAILAGVTAKYGLAGLQLATLMAGIMLLLMGLARMGGVIKFIPTPVIVGFTAGIAVIILISQLRDLLGLTLTNDPADTLPKLRAILPALSTVNPATVALSVLAIGAILVVRRLRPNWPALLISVAAVTAVATAVAKAAMAATAVAAKAATRPAAAATRVAGAAPPTGLDAG